MTEKKESTEKSLDRWRFEIKADKRVWLTFYKEFLGFAAPPIRLYRLVKLYGDLVVMETVVESSVRGLSGDPFAYVSKVASQKWKSIQEQKDGEDQYNKSIEATKEATRKANLELQRAIKQSTPKRPVGRPRKNEQISSNS